MSKPKEEQVGALDLVLHHANLGYSVFPLIPNSKNPAISGWKEAATTDEQTIRDWFNRFPGCNWGLHCKDMIVLDVDKIEQYGNPFFNRLDFDGFPQQVTPGVGKLKDENGSAIGDSPGLHYFFKRPNGKEWGNTAGKYATNVDVKTDRGYIVIAPSTIDGKEYQFILDLPPFDDLPNLPDDVVKRLDEINAKPEQKADSVTSNETAQKGKADSSFASSTPTNWAAPDVRLRAIAYLANCPSAVSGQGGHDKTLWAATCLVWGFALDDESAFNILSNEYNPRCEP
ncbi:MAG: bifunctional DNA primase/polymerase, partial [Thermoguttaceae bacterium]